MRYGFLAVMLACVSMQASALVVEPQQKSEHSKSVHHATNNMPTSTRLAPPSKATLGFYQAAASINYDMMELYLQQGADINCRNCDSQGNTPLLNALPEYRSTAQCIRWLVEHGADVNAANANGITPLMLASSAAFIQRIRGRQSADCRFATGSWSENNCAGH